MSLEAVAGRSYGPVDGQISAAKVAEYVAATGDDPERWAAVAPPSYAGALLFVVAPLLISDPDVAASMRVLVHSDQRFGWTRPIRIGTPVQVTGEVTRVRRRSPIAFVTFEASVSDDDGPLVTSTSTFLMGDEPAAQPGADLGEPAIEAGSHRDPIPVIASLAPGADLPEVKHGASRLDLVHYAAASRDFNPIHLDHDAARAAGLDGIVVHGLLMAAWLARLAGATSTRPDPITEMRLRFRNALRPARSAVAGGTVNAVEDTEARLTLTLRGDVGDLVTGSATVRAG